MIVLRTLVLVAQHIMRFVDAFEHVHRLCIASVEIWVMLFGQTPIG
jgi:hypothetical protein